ncbi:CAP domain-containing protein [Mangrovicoccus algicola]|uniref:CAP domain-containing protein n=1 Tax=Mangrovicoccus algicola TaxID=2771008 RepID=A0A8J7CZZ3_9RHOB|nr:CAP domain-containing protein [Mangrovicoccus algicola]MBE3638683.1 CAP domain-containing protein [Mangrovicoccus algicola]
MLDAFRARNGLAPLVSHPLCEAAARAHAADLARRAVLSHGSGPGNMDTVAQRIAAQGYAWSFAAENVAFGQRDAAEVMAAWEGSPGHHANMASPLAVHFGFGGASNHIGPYWVLVLAAPL